MHIFRKVSPLRHLINKYKKEGKTVGFVPTMGALHEGHVSLVTQCRLSCDICVVSIFVNPTQFDQARDLEKYPKTLTADIDLLVDDGCNVLFYPRDNEIYPEGLDTVLDINFGGLENVMEGAFRPGHFDGMAQVVSRLLDIVEPDRLFMGQKDYQQFTIVRKMLEIQNRNIMLVVCPIIREKDGLAMSSRNRRLTKEYREKAIVLNQILNYTKDHLTNYSIEELEINARKRIEDEGLRLEYFDIVDGKTLEKILNISEHDEVVACLAAWAGEVRLIDNMILIKKE